MYLRVIDHQYLDYFNSIIIFNVCSCCSLEVAENCQLRCILFPWNEEKNEEDHLGLVREGWGLLVGPEEGIEKDVVDEGRDESEVEVRRQVDEAQAVGKAAHQFEAAHPLEPEKEGLCDETANGCYIDGKMYL